MLAGAAVVAIFIIFAWRTRDRDWRDCAPDHRHKHSDTISGDLRRIARPCPASQFTETTPRVRKLFFLNSFRHFAMSRAYNARAKSDLCALKQPFRHRGIRALSL